MQLFQLATEQLRYLNRLIPEIKADVAEQNNGHVLEDVNLPFLPMRVGSPSDTAQEPSEVPDVNLKIITSDDKPADYDAIQRGVNDFVYSALLIAFSHSILSGMPGVPKDDLPVIDLKKSLEDPNQVYLHIEKLDIDTFGTAAVGNMLENMEKLMFNGWRPVNGTPEPTLRKRFANEAQCDIVEHLIRCMARAAGYSDEVTEQNIEVSPNTHSLTIHKEFLAHLAEVEQTLEADFGNRRH